MNYRVLFDHILVDEMKWEYNTFSHALAYFFLLNCMWLLGHL